MNARAPAALAALLVAVSIPLVMGDALPGLVPFLDPVGASALPAPPELRLHAPRDGEGVGPVVRIAGEALSRDREILDVQVRVDGQRWTSLPGLARGARITGFSGELPLPPGDHLLELRAYDGESLSLPARVVVRAGDPAPPTVEILEPRDGQSLSGEIVVSGLVRGDARRVLVEAAGATREAFVAPQAQAGARAWSVALDLPPGEHAITARATGGGESLPQAVRVAVGDPAPPQVSILSPANLSSYGSRGDPSCAASCILLAGTATPGARHVEVLLDGERPALWSAPVDPAGGWTYRLPMLGLYAGEHRLGVRAFGDDGTPGVARHVHLLVRTAREAEIVGDDAPRPTGAPLSFEARGPAVERVSWRLDGRPVGEGARVTVTLPTPGDHVLEARVADAAGRVATARASLFAINRAPVATLMAEPGLTSTPLALRADARDPDGAVTLYRWEFGDGATAETRRPEAAHAYALPGLYRANLTVLDDRGLASAAASALVPVANAPPLADFTWHPEQPTVQDEVVFADATVDPDGSLLARRWTFGDGATSTLAAPTHRFATRGDHLVTLRVTDADGAEGVATRIVHVRNLPPAARFAVEPATPATGVEVVFTDASTDADGAVSLWGWDFGDGANATGRVAAHSYDAPGAYTVRLQVEDDAGAVANATLEVVVQDAAPVIRHVAADPPRPRAREDVLFTAELFDREAELARVVWEFGDNVTSDAFQPLHRYARSGVYRVNLTAIDVAGQEARHAFDLVVTNLPPLLDGVRVASGGYAAFPTVLEVDARDLDGRLAAVRVDADGDGDLDCDGPDLRCTVVYERAGVHEATVVVEDDEGAVATTTLAVEALAPPSDLAPPQVSVEVPQANATLRGQVILLGSAQGVRPIVRVEAQLRDGVFAYAASRDAWMRADGAETWRLLLDTRAFPDGDLTLLVRAIDAQGGVGFASLPLRLANGPAEPAVRVQLAGAPENLTEETLVRGSAWHPDGVTGVRWRVDDGPWRSVDGPALAFGIPLSPADLAPGEHVLQVDAWHGVAERASARLAFRVPREPPVLVVDEPPFGVQYGLLHAAGRVVGQGQAWWRLDHDVWRPLPGNGAWRLDEPTLEMRGGPRTLWLKAVSPDGTMESEPVSYRVEILNPVVHPARPADAPEQERRATPVPALAPFLALLAAAALSAVPANTRTREHANTRPGDASGSLPFACSRVRGNVVTATPPSPPSPHPRQGYRRGATVRSACRRTRSTASRPPSASGSAPRSPRPRPRRRSRCPPSCAATTCSS